MLYKQNKSVPEAELQKDRQSDFNGNDRGIDKDQHPTADSVKLIDINRFQLPGSMTH